MFNSFQNQSFNHKKDAFRTSWVTQLKGISLIQIYEK